jgi:hypothetical protein
VADEIAEVKPENIKVYEIKSAVNLDNVFFSHLFALGVFDYGYTAVELVKTEVLIYIHAASCLNMVENEAFGEFSNIKHVSNPPLY